METIYGPPGWKAREAAEAGCEDLDMQRIVALGQELWAKLGEDPGVEAFWDVVAPLVHALADEDPEKAGFGCGFSTATACEQLMHEVALRRAQGGLA